MPQVLCRVCRWTAKIVPVEFADACRALTPDPAHRLVNDGLGAKSAECLASKGGSANHTLKDFELRFDSKIMAGFQI